MKNEQNNHKINNKNDSNGNQATENVTLVDNIRNDKISIVGLDNSSHDYFANELVRNTLNKYITEEELRWFYSEVVNVDEKVDFIQRVIKALDNEINLINNRGFVPGFELDDVDRFPLTSKFLYDVVAYKPQKDPSMPPIK